MPVTLPPPPPRHLIVHEATTDALHAWPHPVTSPEVQEAARVALWAGLVRDRGVRRAVCVAAQPNAGLYACRTYSHKQGKRVCLLMVGEDASWSLYWTPAPKAAPIRVEVKP